MSGLSYTTGLSDGEGLWRDRLGLWGGAPGLVNGNSDNTQSALLLEDDGFLLQETDFHILLE